MYPQQFMFRGGMGMGMGMFPPRGGFYGAMRGGRGMFPMRGGRGRGGFRPQQK